MLGEPPPSEFPRGHQADVAAEVVGVVAEAVGIVAISAIEEIVGREEEVHTLAGRERESRPDFQAEEVVGRWAVGDEVGGGVEAGLFRDKPMRSFHIGVAPLSPRTDAPRQALRKAERRNEGEIAPGAALLGPHHAATHGIFQARQARPPNVGIKTAKPSIGTAIAEDGIETRHHRGDFARRLVVDVAVDPLRIEVDTCREAWSMVTRRHHPLAAHFGAEGRVAHGIQARGLFQPVAVEFVHVGRTERGAEVGEQVEVGRGVPMHAQRIGEVGVLRTAPVEMAVEVAPSGGKSAVVQAHAHLSAPVRTGILLDEEAAGILLRVVGDDGHHARAGAVLVVDGVEEGAHLARPVLCISVLPVDVEVEGVEAEVEGGHVGAIVAAEVEFLPVVVLPRRLHTQPCAAVPAIGCRGPRHMVHHLLVGVVDGAGERFDIRRAADADALFEQFDFAHLCAVEHTDFCCKEAVVDIDRPVVAHPAGSRREVGFAHTGVVEQIVGRGAVAPVDIGALHAPGGIALPERERPIGHAHQCTAPTVASVEQRHRSVHRAPPIRQ